MNEQARPVFYDEVSMHTYPIDGGYEHIDMSRSLTVLTRNIKQNGHGISAELSILYPDSTPVKSNLLLSLQDSQSRRKLAIELAQTCQEAIPWDRILDFVCDSTISNYRGIAEPEDMATEPVTTKVEYAIDPIIPLNQPTTIFSPGGRGKSIFAAFLAVVYQHGITPSDLNYTPQQGNVLYLDWESDVEQHRKYVKAIKKGLDIKDSEPILYLSCSNPLPAIINSIRTLIQDRKIDFVIVDSQMGATAGMPQGMNEAQISADFYNCLHSLKCTSLTIDHVTKEGMKSTDGAGSPYGSVVKYNRARSIFELRAQQDTDSDRLELALVHQKYNLGRRLKPQGIVMEFKNNNSGELDRIDFSKCNIVDNPVLAPIATTKERLKNVLLDGSATVQELSERLELDQAKIRTELNRHKMLFIKLDGGRWGVLDRNITT